MTSTIDRARNYLACMPGAIEGSRGSDATFAAAVAVRVGFNLDDETAFRLLKEVHNPLCHPPWSDRELKHKVQSAGTRCKRSSGYLLKPQDGVRDRPRLEALPPLDTESARRINERLVELCPITDEPDVLKYVEDRVLLLHACKVQCGGLPPKWNQGPLVASLLKDFRGESLLRVGLLWRDKTTNQPRTDHFAWPDHRLVMPWRNRAGRIDILQRRRIDRCESRKYIFPSGWRPQLPFGAEELGSMGPETAVIYAEGALDVLALRLCLRRDHFDAVALGLPGCDGWKSAWARFAADRVAFVATDPDEKGESAAAKISADLLNAGATGVKRLLPKGGAHDWADALERGLA